MYLPILLLLIGIFVKSTYSQNCPRYQCETSSAGTSYCLFEESLPPNAGIVYTYPSYCPGFDNATYNQVCIMHNTPFSNVSSGTLIRGQCQAEYASASNPESRYPGEPCDSTQQEYVCVTGYQRCNNGRCKGYERGMYCGTTADCDPGLYCKNGICSVFESVGSPCYDYTACGRTARCVGTTITIPFPGTCVSYMSLPNGALTPLQNNFDHFLCATGNANAHPVSPQYRICGDGGTSTNKGQQCATTNDCPSSSGVFLQCECQPDDTGLMHCPPDFGDSDWANVYNLWQKYYDATTTCHVSRGFLYACDRPDLFNPYACAYYKFIYYNYGYSASSCLWGMANSELFPQLELIGSVCTSTTSGVRIVTPFLLIIVGVVYNMLS